MEKIKRLWSGFFKGGVQTEGEGRSPAERRTSPRREKVFLAEFFIEDEKHIASVINFSAGGMCLQFENKIEVGSCFELVLLHGFGGGGYDSKKYDLKIPVQVVWVHKESSPHVEGEGEEMEDAYKAGVRLSQDEPNVLEQYSQFLDHLDDEDFS